MQIDINKLVPNSTNPRIIKESKFKKLVESIKNFPEMLELRPIIVDEDMVILGGNMRHKACLEAGLKKVHIKVAKGLTENQKKEFIVKDNVGFGEWEWDLLANDWDNIKLGEWGLDVWQPEEAVDYGVLDDLDLGTTLEDKEANIKRAIQIEFIPSDYDTAQELISKLRKANIYIGSLIIEKLKQVKC